MKRMLKRYRFFIIIIILGLISLISVYSKFQDLAKRNRELKLKMKQLVVQNKILAERQHKLETDPVFAESVARQQLNAAKEGEVIYKIFPEE